MTRGDHSAGPGTTPEAQAGMPPADCSARVGRTRGDGSARAGVPAADRCGPDRTTPVDRLARALVKRAAARWPADVAAAMAEEWRAELAVIPSAAGKLRFAVSLAVSPAVEEFDADPVPRLESWGRSLAGAAGIALLAGALINAIRLVQHHLGAAPAILAWLLAALVMTAIARRSQASLYARTVAIGAALFGFLLAGNSIAVMPFMGWKDILPAVATWTILTTLLAYGVNRASRRRTAVMFALAGGAVTLDVAAIAGSVHAAAGLGLGFASAPSWFPLSLLPGPAVTFGPPLAVVGLPGFHASQMLLGNASAMVGPMLLCTVFVLSLAFGPSTRAPLRPRVLAVFGARLDGRTLCGVGAAVAALAVAQAVGGMRPGGFEATWNRLLDNSTVFGFGFLDQTSGRVVTALIAGLVGTHLGVTRHRPGRGDTA